MDLERQKRLDAVALCAIAAEAKYQTPAIETVTQWAIESQWGAKPAGHANYFGIKRAARHTQFCLVTTHEEFTQAELAVWNRKHPDRPARIQKKLPNGSLDVLLDDEFADYPDLAASVDDFAWLISRGAPYAAAWASYRASGDVQQLIASVAKVYAKSSAYAELARQISTQQNVLTAIAQARASQVPA